MSGCRYPLTVYERSATISFSSQTKRSHPAVIINKSRTSADYLVPVVLESEICPTSATVARIHSKQVITYIRDAYEYWSERIFMR